MSISRAARYGFTGLALLMVAGCGLDQVQSTTKPTPTVPVVPSPTPIPTISVSGGSVAATVAGRPIPMARFKRFLNADNQLNAQSGAAKAPSAVVSDTVNELAQFDVVSHYAAAHHLTVTTAAITKELNTQVQGSTGNVTFRNRLSSLGFSASDIDYIARVYLLETKVQKVISPGKKSGPIATARHILISPTTAGSAKNPCSAKALTLSGAKALAVKLLNQIKSGKQSFAAVAKKCSADTSSGTNGGIVQDPASPGSTKLYDVGSFVPPFETAVFHGPLHTLQLVQSQYGWHIIQVLSRHTGPYPANESSNLQYQQFQRWLNKTVARSHVKILVKTH